MAIRQWATLIASLMPLTGSDPAPWPAWVTPAPDRYYVAPAGSDTHPGSSGSPFRTLQKAAEVAGPGDTVVVRPGTYTGGSRMVSLSRSGEPGNPITFLSERRWGAILDGRDQSLVAWYFDAGVGHIRVEGFEIRDLREHGFDFYGGGVHDITIVRNHVHHVGRNCTDTSNGRTGASIGAGASRVTFDGNVWHHIGRFAPGEQGCTPKTEHYKNHDHGIYVENADRVTIKNNVFYGFGRGWPIHRYSSRDAKTRGLSIVNNTFVGQNTYREGQIILASPTEGLKIENNVFHGPNRAALYFENLRFPGASVRHNMVYGGVIKVGRPRGVTFSRNWERTDPRLRELPDFRLRYDSPAIDAGLPLAEVTEDADGVRRPRGSGYDIGAYER
ncbi:MAG: right-handed parallel beta-helix repeat-containing protein [Gemmatimonadota bacterium]|nr:right-handed parallel beta-helix repeat-containing protein [Gemmatimonadota bacterium]